MTQEWKVGTAKVWVDGDFLRTNKAMVLISEIVGARIEDHKSARAIVLYLRSGAKMMLVHSITSTYEEERMRQAAVILQDLQQAPDPIAVKSQLRDSIQALEDDNGS